MAVDSVSGVQILDARTLGSRGIADAVELGNAAKATLGLLPLAVYDEATSKDTLLIARVGECSAGYALFSLARRRVRLIHLCVSPEYRGKDIARTLVDAISSRHRDLLGIAVRCRRDYNLGEMWVRLGFTQLGERPGRGDSARTIVDWWLDHDHPHLFSVDTESVLVRAAVDLNVLRDFVEKGRPGSIESRALLDDQLTGQLELVRTGALDAEMDAVEGPLRESCVRQAQSLQVVRAERGARRAAIDALRAGAIQIQVDYPRTKQDERDLEHVAQAVACGLNVLVTRDQDLRRVLGPPAREQGLRVLSPVEVIVHIDELAHAEAYRPVVLLGTKFTERRLGLEDHDVLGVLASSADGERPKQWKRLLSQLAVENRDRRAVYDPSGVPVAAYCAWSEGNVLVVPLLRVVNTSLGDTLARQILFRLRQQARLEGSSAIRLSDPHLSRRALIAALGDGFGQSDGHLHCLTLARAADADDIELAAAVAARAAGLPEPPPLRSSMPAAVAAELEREWWPAKILDSALKTYVLPIRQAYSADLLGVPAGLLPRNDALGINREHVYYRSPKGMHMEAPGRLVWYISEGGKVVPESSAIVACSQLDLVAMGETEKMYERFRHLGVWDLKTIASAANDNQVQAIRFSNTEIFSTPIPRRQIDGIARRMGLGFRPPQGPVAISSEFFAELYAEGIGE